MTGDVEAADDHNSQPSLDGDFELSEGGLESTTLLREPNHHTEEDENDDREYLGLETMSSSSSSGSEEGGLAWSLSSNFLFLLGSAIYTWLGIWDLQDAKYDSIPTPSPSPTPVVSSDTTNDSGDEDPVWDSYTILIVIAALSFVISSIVDLLWYLYGNNPRTAIGVATAFGIGSTCELLAVYLSEEEKPIAEMRAYIVSSHVYLLSAILQVTRRCPTFSSPTNAMEGLGDIFFFMGSAIDAILSYFNDPEMLFVNPIVLARWNLVSAVLWLVDAVLYILSDFMVHSVCTTSTFTRLRGNDMGVPLLIEASRTKSKDSS